MNDDINISSPAHLIGKPIVVHKYHPLAYESGKYDSFYNKICSLVESGEYNVIKLYPDKMLPGETPTMTLIRHMIMFMEEADKKMEVVVCKKCGKTANNNTSKYCGDGSDKDNEHRWEKKC